MYGLLKGILGPHRLFLGVKCIRNPGTKLSCQFVWTRLHRICKAVAFSKIVHLNKSRSFSGRGASREPGSAVNTTSLAFKIRRIVFAASRTTLTSSTTPHQFLCTARTVARRTPLCWDRKVVKSFDSSHTNHSLLSQWSSRIGSNRCHPSIETDNP